MTEIHPPPTPRQHLWLLFFGVFFFNKNDVSPGNWQLYHIYIRIFHIAISLTRGYLHFLKWMFDWFGNILSGYHNSVPRQTTDQRNPKFPRWSAFSNYLLKVKLKIKCYTSKNLKQINVNLFIRHKMYLI